MRALIYLVTAMAVLGLAFWAYRENYRTQAQIDQMQSVQKEIARLRVDLGVLRAEWAYLNRPERLRELVDLNFERLKLGPVQANQFGTARNIDYPDPNAVTPSDPAADAQLPPAPSHNKGAPKPRPLRPGAGGQVASAADAEVSPADSADEPAIDMSDEPPSDTAVTQEPTQ